MNKDLLLFLLLCISVVFVGCFKKSEEIKVSEGCCQISGGCASGQGVTEQYCSDELKGEWFSGTQCNTSSGKCE